MGPSNSHSAIYSIPALANTVGSRLRDPPDRLVFSYDDYTIEPEIERVIFKDSMKRETAISPLNVSISLERHPIYSVFTTSVHPYTHFLIDRDIDRYHAAVHMLRVGAPVSKKVRAKAHTDTAWRGTS